ncbi:amidohydrolase family protein [Streptomyces drozdowiczii]|uniref:6-methylsalicylate decarboxylase n=1 Tax=Streptomyces drozdowiczii TaxID=202862 RepID=A0ABY6PZP8_9ACTN|nr:amidohydrolase family protein [Streptomyces drozdowiczii]MCX0242266.1 amidohydrolase [Streptomyces drozdowiczii]UZK57663.1 amidohydrolase [Streptomyces drozdowiczii]
MTPTGLIDVHAHFVTDAYADAARSAGITHPDGMPGWPSWSVEQHLDLMDDAGIARSYLSVSSPGVHFGDDRAARALAREVNGFGARVRAGHPDRFGQFASLPLPDVEGALTEAAYALDVLGADGVAVETNHHGLYLGDPRLEPLWEALDSRGALVFVHPTSPPHADETALGRPRPMLEFLFDTARAASDLLLRGVFTRHPRIRWVLTHGGGALPLLADRIDLFRTITGGDGPSAVEQLGRLWYDMAGTPFPRQIPALDAAFGTERLLYGSDYCWTPAEAARAQIASVDAAVPPSATDTWRDLTTRNAHRLFAV